MCGEDLKCPHKWVIDMFYYIFEGIQNLATFKKRMAKLSRTLWIIGHTKSKLPINLCVCACACVDNSERVYACVSLNATYSSKLNMAKGKSQILHG